MTSLEQAKKIYGLLTAAKAPLTYGQVLSSLGYPKRCSGNAIRYGLELVLVACADKRLPRLASIVVNQATNSPTGDKTDLHVFEKKEWPRVDAIDWNYIWKNRRQLSEQYGTPGYWGN